MFSKVIALLLLATCTIARRIPEGTYQITNLASLSAARVGNTGGPLCVSSEEDPDQYALVSPRVSVIFLQIC